MLFEDSYTTIKGPTQATFKDRGSKFIGFAFAFDNEVLLKEILLELKKEHSKANHHCFAYRIGMGKINVRVNDDGEPNGTAGKPILNQLLSMNITNTLIVVIRYFGGTLLGVSGLINAYGSTARLCLESAELIEKYICDVYQINCTYEDYDMLMRFIKQYEIEVETQMLTEVCMLKIKIRKLKLNGFLNDIKSLYNLKISYLYTV